MICSLPITEQCTDTDGEILLTLYECKRKKYHTSMPPNKFTSGKLLGRGIKKIGNIANSTPQSVLFGTSGLLSTTPASISTPKMEDSESQRDDELNMELVENPLLIRLQDSLDLAVSEAERLYYNCDYQQCHALTEFILKQDPFHYDCLPIHISCEVELKQRNSMCLF